MPVAPVSLKDLWVHFNLASHLPPSICFMNSLGSVPSTLTPMLTQLPTTSLTAERRVLAYDPETLLLAIPTTLSKGRSATNSRLGFAEPFAIPASFAIRAEVVGVPTLTENCLVSWSTSTLTGTLIPLKSAVALLISFTMARTLTPRGPRAGPRGGPAVAAPPATRAEMTLFLPNTITLLEVGVGFQWRI